MSEEEFRHAFGLAEAYFVNLDHYDPINPLKVPPCDDMSCDLGQLADQPPGIHTWSCYMKHDIRAMLECDAIAMLPNWEQSKGAHLEKLVALECGLELLHITDDYRSHY